MVASASTFLPAEGLSLIKETVLTGTGTHTLNPRTKFVRLLLSAAGGGGGGGGGGAGSTYGVGGGAGIGGEMFAIELTAAALGSSPINYTCGAGGVGGAGASATTGGSAAVYQGQPGTAGGDTTFGDLAAMGGAGGKAGDSGGNVGSVNQYFSDRYSLGPPYMGRYAANSQGPLIRYSIGGSSSASPPDPVAPSFGVGLSDYGIDFCGPVGGVGASVSVSLGVLNSSGGRSGSVFKRYATGGPSSQASVSDATGAALAGSDGLAANPLAGLPGTGGGGGGASGTVSTAITRTGGKGGNGGLGAGGGGGGGASCSVSGTVIKGGNGGNGGNGFITIREFG